MHQPLNKIIDPHLHLFNLDEGKYDWLAPKNPPFWPDKEKINHNFFETDLQLNLPQQLAGFVHIEAGFNNHQPWREIDWLEQNCTLPFKSVAFADICAETFPAHIQQLMQRHSVVGVRHILDDAAYKILTSVFIHKHLTLLQTQTLSFDAQLSITDDKAIAQLARLAGEYPQLKIIINHGGWPLNANTADAKNIWRANLIKLSHYKNVAIKLSGWEMSNRKWQFNEAAQVVNECLEVLGEQRVMLASNFPLCIFSQSYAELWAGYSQLTGVTDSCFNNISYINALHWYQFH